MAHICTFSLMIIFVLQGPLQLVSCSIITKPTDSTAILGGNITLYCESDSIVDMIEWKSYARDHDGEMIYDSTGPVGGQDKYVVCDQPYNIQIRDVTWQDGGKYSCSEYGGSTHGMQLVVIDSPTPTVKSDVLIEGQGVELHCSAKYSSSTESSLDSDHLPQLRAYIAGVIQAPAYYHRLAETSRGVSTLVITLYYTPWVSEQFTCEVSTMTPDVTLQSSVQLDVQFPARNLQIYPREYLYHVNDVITCTAEGNPRPQIAWQAISSPRQTMVIDGLLDITADMMGDNEWECMAMNRVTGFNSVTDRVSFVVVADTTAVSTTTPTNILSILPSNTTASVGDTVVLSCHYDTTLTSPPSLFFWMVDTQKQTHTVYDATGGVYDSRKFAVEESSWSLRLISATLEDGGKYTCGVGQTVYSAELVVIDQPQCTAEELMEDTNSVVKCSLQFSSSDTVHLLPDQIPYMSVQLEDTVPLTVTTSELKLHVPGRISRLYMEFAFTPDSAHNGRNLTCTVGTVDPEFRRTFIQQINVKYGAQNMVITPHKSEYLVGDTVECTAEGNPTPQITWQDATSPRATASNGQRLVIGKTMIGSNKWTCMASNDVNSSLKQTITFVVKTNGSGCSVCTTPAVLMALLSAILALLAY